MRIQISTHYQHSPIIQISFHDWIAVTILNRFPANNRLVWRAMDFTLSLMPVDNILADLFALFMLLFSSHLFWRFAISNYQPRARHEHQHSNQYHSNQQQYLTLSIDSVCCSDLLATCTMGALCCHLEGFPLARWGVMTT